MRASQARGGQRIQHSVVCLGIEQRPGSVECTGPPRQPRNEQPRICRAAEVAGVATDTGLARDISENRWRVEGNIAQKSQIRLPPPARLRSEGLSRPIQRLVAELAAGRQ